MCNNNGWAGPGRDRGCYWSPGLGLGPQLQQHLCRSCQLSVYNNLRPGILPQETVPPGLRVSLPFPLTRAGAHLPPNSWVLYREGGMRGQGAGAGCGPSFFSFTSLAWRAALSFGAPVPDPNWTNASTGSQGLGCTGKTGQDYQQAEWICLNPSRSRFELITAKVIVWKLHSLGRTVPIPFILPCGWFRGLPASHGDKGKGGKLRG